MKVSNCRIECSVKLEMNEHQLYNGENCMMELRIKRPVNQSTRSVEDRNSRQVESLPGDDNVIEQYDADENNDGLVLVRDAGKEMNDDLQEFIRKEQEAEAANIEHINWNKSVWIKLANRQQKI